MKCLDCDGTGAVEIMNCHDYSNECCGGCYKEIMCDDCQGTGSVYSEDDEDEDPQKDSLKNLWIELS
jgi:hypothetical protein